MPGVGRAVALREGRLTEAVVRLQDLPRVQFGHSSTACAAGWPLNWCHDIWVFLASSAYLVSASSYFFNSFLRGRRLASSVVLLPLPHLSPPLPGRLLRHKPVEGAEQGLESAWSSSCASAAQVASRVESWCGWCAVRMR